jgi:DNA-binding transcriptional LysR family regulator
VSSARKAVAIELFDFENALSPQAEARLAMDQLLALRAFVRIAESDAFAKAAAQLSLPRSTVSKLIADLEEYLGAKLIQRTTRTVMVTPEWADYYKRAVRFVGEPEDMDAAARRTRAQPKGRLRVDVGSSLANLILIPALLNFPETLPRYRGLSWRQRSSGRPDRRRCVLRHPRRGIGGYVSYRAAHTRVGLCDMRGCFLCEGSRCTCAPLGY